MNYEDTSDGIMLGIGFTAWCELGSEAIDPIIVLGSRIAAVSLGGYMLYILLSGLLIRLNRGTL